jgi:hypothetical protein
MDLGITCRTAVVCACTSGLGEAIARALAAESAHVVVSGRRGERARQIAGELPSAVGVEVDLTDPAGDERLLAPAREAFGEVDILVLNGPGPSPARLRRCPSPTSMRRSTPCCTRRCGLVSEVRRDAGAAVGPDPGGGVQRDQRAAAQPRAVQPRPRRAGRLPQDAGRRGRRRRRDGEPAAIRPDRDRPWTRRRPREPAPDPESHVIGGGFPAMLAASAGSQPHTLHKF